MINLVNINKNVGMFRTGGPSGMPYTEEPTYLTFSIEFVTAPWVIESLKIYNSPLFITPESVPSASAENFLQQRGFYPEAARISEFRKQIINIRDNAPWFMQSIKGLDKLWTNSTTMSQNFKGKDAVLEIGTLESLDLKISYLADLYRKSVYDTLYMRELLPENLRWFEMNVYVAEFRSITSLLYNISKNPATTVQSVIQAQSEYFNKYATFMMFHCYMCEFDFSNSMPSGEYKVYDMDNQAANTFKINVGAFLEQHEYSFYETMTKTDFSQHEAETSSDDTNWKRKKDSILRAVSDLVLTD